MRKLLYLFIVVPIVFMSCDKEHQLYRIQKNLSFLFLIIGFIFSSCNKNEKEIQHQFYGAVLGQTKEQVCDSLDKNHISYKYLSSSYLDYDYLTIEPAELAGYIFTELEFQINIETKVVYSAIFKKEEITKDLFEEFLDKLEDKYPLIKVEDVDLYQGDFGYEGEHYMYQCKDFTLTYTYYAPQNLIVVSYYYTPQKSNEL